MQAKETTVSAQQRSAGAFVDDCIYWIEAYGLKWVLNSLATACIITAKAQLNTLVAGKVISEREHRPPVYSRAAEMERVAVAIEALKASVNEQH